jgi:serine/threonine-protein kinase
MVEEVFGGRYRLDGLLGRGSYCEVRRATDIESGAPVAIKRPRASAHAGEEPGDVDAILLTEAAVLQRLRHPAIVQLLRHGTHGGHPYLVLEYLDGPSLLAQLRNEPLDDARIAALGACLADALAVAHAAGIVHGDVKPANVILVPGGVPKLTDFGTARDVLQTLPPRELRQVVGTLAYIPPEVLAGTPADARSDVYSLAVTLFEARTGALPFGPADGFPARSRGRARARKLRSVAPGASPALERVLAKAMRERPSRRQQSAAELGAELRRVALPAAGREAHGGRRRPLLAASVAGAMLSVGIAAAIGLRPGSESSSDGRVPDSGRNESLLEKPGGLESPSPHGPEATPTTATVAPTAVPVMSGDEPVDEAGTGPKEKKREEPKAKGRDKDKARGRP